MIILELRINEDGTAELHKEPYATIECETQADYERLVGLLEENKELKKKIKDMSK